MRDSSRVGVLPTSSECDRNAQHGQNRAGIEVDADLAFDDFSALRPIDTGRAEACIADEGAEIRARIHERGNDVLAPMDEVVV